MVSILQIRDSATDILYKDVLIERRNQLSYNHTRFIYFFFTSPRSMSYISVPNTLVGNASFESKSIDAPSPLLRKDKKTSGGLKSALDLLKALLLPIIAIAYLGFCYAVHYRTVPVNTYGIVNTSPSNLGRFPGTIGRLSRPINVGI